MSVTAKCILAGFLSAFCFLVACEFPERPTILRISKAPVFRPSTLDEVKTVEQALFAVISATRDHLHLPAVDPLIVYTYRNKASFALFGPGQQVSIDVSNIAAAATKNEMHVNIGAMKDLPLGHFLEIFAHEYAHNLQYAATSKPEPIPTWFSEGFAGWVAAGVLHSLGWQDYEISLHRTLRELTHHREIVPYLSWLENPKSWNNQSKRTKGAVRTYVPATVAVQRLIQRGGLSAVTNYFRTARFDKAFGLSLNEFSTQFDNYVAQLGAEKEVPFEMDMPNWKINDQWLYARKLSGKIIRVERKIVKETPFRGVPCFVVNVGNEQILYTQDSLNPLVNMEDGKLITSRDKPNAVLNWPLTQGKQWRNSYKFEDFKRGNGGVIDQSMVVSNLEKVKVSAGVFDSAKVEAYDAATGRLVAEFWYSPKAKWMVKTRLYVGIDGFTEDELIGFSFAD